jgi:hypothetical protein
VGWGVYGSEFTHDKVICVSLSHKATKKNLGLSILNFFLDITSTMKALKTFNFSLTRWGG